MLSYGLPVTVLLLLAVLILTLNDEAYKSCGLKGDWLKAIIYLSVCLIRHCIQLWWLVQRSDHRERDMVFWDSLFHVLDGMILSEALVKHLYS